MESFFIGLSPDGEGREQYADYFWSASDFVEYPNNSYNQPFCRASR